MNTKKHWIKPSITKSRSTISEFEKYEIIEICQPLIDKFKKQHIRSNPDKRFNYLIDVYVRWRGKYLYFCEKYKSEKEKRLADEFEVKFVRLEYTRQNSYKFSYLRHTGQWYLVATDLTLQDCLEMMQDNPVFQPLG